MNPANPAFWRIVLIDGGAFLVLSILAFVTLTFLGRAMQAGLSPGDSLIGRVSGSVVLAAVATSPIVLFNLFLIAGIPSFETLTVDDSRTQTILGLLGGVALAGVLVFRIETYHRRLTSGGPKEQTDDWNVDGANLGREPPRPKSLSQ